jgi:hypothetical protein
MRERPCPPRLAATGLALLLAVSAAHSEAHAGPKQAASKTAAPRKAPGVLTCTGPFARSMSHASLVKAFGANNVAVQTVGTVEGETEKVSVIFPRDKTRRIEVLWRDDKRRRNPVEIRLGVASTWQTAQGIRRGTPLSEVEALNGRPFKLYGFGFDYGGMVIDWNGGRLAARENGCALSLRFTMRENADNAAVYVGEQSFSSDDAGMQKAAPIVDALSLEYGE